MSSAEPSTFNRHGFDRSFASGAARQSKEMVHALEYPSLADRVRRTIAANRSYDKRYETKHSKNGPESYNIGSFLRKSFMPALGERTTYPKLDQLKTRFISGQGGWTGNNSDNIRLQMNKAKSWLDNTSSDTQAYERKSFQAKLEQASNDIDTNKRTIKSLRDQLDQSETDLMQSQSRERQLEDELENAKRDLKRVRNESNQGRDLADHEREQRLHMEQEFEDLLNSQKQHIYNLREELEKERSAAKTIENDRDIILDLESKIKRFQTELEIEKRMKDEAKRDHADIQAELDELLSENEGLRNKLRQSKQDNERFQDENQDLIEEYKGIMENNFCEELEARILEGEAIANRKFDRERDELVTEIEQYRQYGEQLQEENNEFKVRMQRKLEELKQVRSELSKSESYRQQDIDHLLQEKESLKIELKKKKSNLASVERSNEELLEIISQMEREIKKLQKRKSNAEKSLVVKNGKPELEKTLEGKEFETANLNAKIKDLKASSRCQNNCQQDINALNLKLKEQIQIMDAEISDKDSQIAALNKLSRDLTDQLQTPEINSSQEMTTIQDELSQKLFRLQETSEAERQGLTEKIAELKEQNAALQDSCKHSEGKEDAALEHQACETRHKQFQDENTALAAKLQELTKHLEDINEQNAALNDSCKQFEVKATKNEVAALQHQACETKFKEFADENAEQAAKLQELTVNLNEINNQKAALEESCKHFKNMAAQNEEAAVKFQASEAKLNKLEEKNAELKSQLLENNTVIEEFKQSKRDIEVLKRQASELEIDLQAKDSAIAEIQGQECTFTELKEENDMLHNEVHDLKDNLQKAESKVAARENEFHVQLQDLNDLVDRMSAQEKEITATNKTLKNEIKELKYSVKETENYLETKQEKFEKEVQELEQKIVFMKTEEKQLRRCIADLELQLNEERKKTKDFPKQDLQNKGEQFATLEARINDLESDKQELDNLIQSSKKQLQDQEKTFEATRKALIKKLQEAEKKCQQSITDQLALEAKHNESKAAQKDLAKRVADCEAMIAEKEAAIQDNATKIAESEQLLAKSEEERLQSEKELEHSQAILDKWGEEFNALIAENDQFREKLGKFENASEAQTITADNSDKLKEEIQELQESLTTMKEREGRIQNHNYEMKKKVDAGDKLQKELERKINELKDELSGVKQDLEHAEIEIKTHKDEENVLNMQNNNWEELKNIAEQRKSEVIAKDKLIDEIDAENRKFRADIRKVEFTVRELEDKIERLESEKEECQELKEFYQEQFEKRKDNQELLERTENDLKKAYEDLQVLSKEKKQLTIKCHQLEDEKMKSGCCEQQKDESAKPKTNPTAEEKEQDDQNGGYESDFDEEDEKSASENGGKEYNSWDRESIASDVSEREDPANNNNNKVDDNNSNINSNNNNDSADDSQNHIERNQMDNQHHDDNDDDGSVNFSDDSDDLLNIMPSETGTPSASVKDQGSVHTTKSTLSKTGRKKSSPKKEAKRRVTFNNDEQVRCLAKDDCFEESSDDEDFCNEGYVPSFSGRSTGTQPDNAEEKDISEEIKIEDFEEEDDTDMTSLANQRSGASKHDIFEEEDDMLCSFVSTQKKKQKVSFQASKQKKMEIELGLADSIDDLIDEIEASEGSEDEATGAKDAKKEATAKGSGEKAAKTGARDDVKHGVANNNDSNKMQIPQNSEEKCGQNANEESEENVTEDITVEEINVDEADYFEHIEPLKVDAENELNFPEAENENLQNFDGDSSITGIERRPSDILFSPSLPTPQRKGLPPIAGRAGALPPLRAGAGLPPLGAGLPPLGARAGVLRPLRRKKNL